MAKAVLTRLWQSLLHEFVFVVELGLTQILRKLSVFFCLHCSRSFLFWIFSQGSQSQPKMARSLIFSNYIVFGQLSSQLHSWLYVCTMKNSYDGSSDTSIVRNLVFVSDKLEELRKSAVPYPHGHNYLQNDETTPSNPFLLWIYITT